METLYSPVTPSVFRTVLSVDAVISETNNGDNKHTAIDEKRKLILMNGYLTRFVSI